MPTRNYGSLDVVNYVPVIVSGTPTVDDPAFGIITVSQTDAGSADTGGFAFAVLQTGELTFSNIPSNAVIFSVTQTIRWMYNVSAGIDNSGPELITLAHAVDMIFPYIFPEAPIADATIVSFSDSENALNSLDYFQSESGVHSYTVNYPNGIDKTTLIASHGILGNEIFTQLAFNIDSPGSGPFSIAALFKYSNFNFAVNYNEGPLTFDLVENGDNVIVGQEITILSKNRKNTKRIIKVLIGNDNDNDGENNIEATIIRRNNGRIVFKVPNYGGPSGRSRVVRVKLKDSGKGPGISGGPIILIDPVTGTQFSGTVIIGALVIIYSESSGIYELVLNKTNDTLYLHDTGETEDVAIPEPFAKTGFSDG